ncbi:hypothetical protein DDE18_01700 [Nocardioides gansuensis]|uniref:DUF4393 domain-containing protein n=1 Tax=Nocardioides gansuensis TaxID=2138300 RepID=A0A2T8FF78_9ACTN|nr:Abi-alpha family protein [Nocardioides gansuensis]PVG84363.1 hypothetical protein DDE18_01700 [Nocardioides gansuensis]
MSSTEYDEAQRSRDRSSGHDLPELAGIDAVPGLVRIGVTSWVNTTSWGLRSSARLAGRVAKAAASPDEARALAKDVTDTGKIVASLARSVASGSPLPAALTRAGGQLVEVGSGSGPMEPEPVEATVVRGPFDGPRTLTLREKGAELLERSRDVWNTDTAHPAHDRILGELAPDEARVLLLLLTGGPQPSVDVRTGGPLGMVSSELVAPGLTMIGARSGCRYLDQVPSYLNNLFRLGLIWFSREQLRDPLEYQVVEAQPEVIAAMHSVKFPKVVRRSIHLTPFGEDFCRTCFLDEDDAAVGLPEHLAPPQGQEAGDPLPRG